MTGWHIHSVMVGLWRQKRAEPPGGVDPQTGRRAANLVKRRPSLERAELTGRPRSRWIQDLSFRQNHGRSDPRSRSRPRPWLQGSSLGGADGSPAAERQPNPRGRKRRCNIAAAARTRPGACCSFSNSSVEQGRVGSHLARVFFGPSGNPAQPATPWRTSEVVSAMCT